MTMNVVMLLLISILDVCYMFKGGLMFKSAASMMFVLTGLINLTYCVKNKVDLKFPMWMMTAFIWAMLGDILLLFNFYYGAVAFALGHVFYFVAYCMLKKINRRDFICGISILGIALGAILFVPFLEFQVALMQGVCCLYALIISFMVGKAVSSWLREKSILNAIILVGSVLFFISDLMLLLNKFGDVSWASYLCLGTYYPAQFLLAFSLFIYVPSHSLKPNRDRV